LSWSAAASAFVSLYHLFPLEHWDESRNDGRVESRRRIAELLPDWNSDIVSWTITACSSEYST
jgi:hypothetical protein